MRFFKNDSNGEGELEIFTRNGERGEPEPGMGGGGFIMGVWRFLKSLYIVGRPVLPPIFMKTPL